MKLKPKTNPFSPFVAICVALGAAQFPAISQSVSLTPTGPASNAFSFHFPAQPGAAYTVQTTTNLASPAWSNTVVLPGNGTNLCVPNPTALPQQYFRVMASAPATPAAPPQIGPPGALSAYWNFNDLAVSNQVTSWTDRVGGLKLVAPGTAPADTAMGVLFGSPANSLTCPGLAVGTNFSLWIVFRPNLLDANFRYLVAGSTGAGLAVANGGLYTALGSGIAFGGQLNHSGIEDTNETFDLVSSGGSIYTNGLICSNGVGAPSQPFVFTGLGSAVNNNNFSGYVQYVGLWANYQLTAGDVAALDAWVNTVGVTNVTGGLAVWYRMDEGTGLTSADASGNGNTAGLAGGPGWTPGMLGYSLAFSGNGQTLQAGNIIGNSPGFSTSFWITGDNWLQGVVAAEDGGASVLDQSDYTTEINGQGWGVFADSAADLKGYVSDANDNYYESPPVQLNFGYWQARWHHVVCNYFYRTPLVDIYLDGVLAGDSPFPAEKNGTTPATIASTAPLYIGGNIEGQDASCQMDEVRVYNRPLSAQEIAILYRWRGQP